MTSSHTVDVVEVEIPEIGVWRNPIVAESWAGRRT
jgi:hypothetical protein